MEDGIEMEWKRRDLLSGKARCLLGLVGGKELAPLM